MQWFRNLFGNKAARPRRAPSVRPQLEALEERQLLNASSVIDSSGAKTTFVTYNTGVAFEYGPNFTGQIGTGVRLVNGYKDINGKVGFDIVYNTGFVAEFDSTGARTLYNAGSGVLDVSRAFDANGNTQLDVLFNDGKGFGLGNLFQYTNKGASQIASNATFATAYVDTNGNLGLAYGIFDIGHGVIQAFAVDTTAVRTLYNGSSGGDPVTDFSQTVGTNTAVYDITFGFGGCQEFTASTSPLTATGVVAIGNDNIASP